MNSQMWIVIAVIVVMSAMLGSAATLLVQKVWRAAGKFWRWLRERRRARKAKAAASKAVAADEFAFDNMAFQPDPLAQSNLSRHRYIFHGLQVASGVSILTNK